MWGLKLCCFVVLINYGNTQGERGFRGREGSVADGGRGFGDQRGFEMQGGSGGFDMRGQGGGGGGGGFRDTSSQASSRPRGPPPVYNCPRDRRIGGFYCGGQGPNVMDCPGGSQCVTDPATRAQICCWEDTSTVSAPCEDPMMRGGQFVTCSPASRERGQGRPCPGSCHNCEVLRGMESGLCCPQITRRGCERSSPMRNEFEASRRRIQSGEIDSGADPALGGGTGMAGGTGMGGTMGGASGMGGVGGMGGGMGVAGGMGGGMGAGMGAMGGAGAMGGVGAMGGAGGMGGGFAGRGTPGGFVARPGMGFGMTGGAAGGFPGSGVAPFGMTGFRPPFAPGVMGRGMMMGGFRGVPMGMGGPGVAMGARRMF